MRFGAVSPPAADCSLPRTALDTPRADGGHQLARGIDTRSAFDRSMLIMSMRMLCLIQQRPAARVLSIDMAVELHLPAPASGYGCFGPDGRFLLTVLFLSIPLLMCHSSILRQRGAAS